MPPRPPHDPEARFDRHAWRTVIVVAGLLAAGLAILAYRFTLPTDGWKAETIGEEDVFLYVENLMGTPSGLQAGDRVAAVEGMRPPDPVPPQLQAAWRAGATLTYTVRREGVELPVTVTLTHWQFGRWLAATLRSPADLAALMSSALLLAMAAFVFWQRPGNAAARSFLLLITALTATDLATGILPATWPELIDRAAFLLAGPGASVPFYAMLLPFSLIHFGLVFPNPKAILRRRPWLSWLPPLIGLVASFVPGEIPLGWIWFVLSILVMLGLLAHTAFTSRDAVSQAQVLWGLSGLLFGFGLLGGMLAVNTFGLAAPFYEAAYDVASTAAFTVIGLTLSIAITRYRLFDIDVILRRTLVYGVITAILALVYFGSVVILQSLVRGVTGGESPLVIVLSTLLIAALFAPVRARVQRAIDRRFYRRKYDAAKTLAAFGSAARDEVNLERLNAQLQQTVVETMQPASVGLWLRPVREQKQS